MTGDRSLVDRRTVLKAMGVLTAGAGLGAAEGAATTSEPLAYGVGGYGEGPYPGGTSGTGGSDGSTGVLGTVGTLAGHQPSADAWTAVDLPDASAPPVVIAQGVTQNGRHPVHVRVRDAHDGGFSYRFEEWEYLDGLHVHEEVGYLAIPPGRHTLADGTPLLAGRVRTGTGWADIAFADAFADPPVVFAQPQTFDESEAVISRVRNVSRFGFQTRLQEEEALGSHADETVGYVAFPAGRTTIDGVTIETGTTSGGVGSDWTHVPFERTFTDPSVVAGFQTTNGPDTTSVRVRNVGPDGMEVTAHEETSADAETTHIAENVGYVVVERA